MGRLKTTLCDRLGLELPIVCAGMGQHTGPALAAAVSNAGGLGVLGGSGIEAEMLRDWIRKTKELTSRPFGVDLILPARIDLELPPIDALREKIPPTHREFAEDLVQRYSETVTENKAKPRNMGEGFTIPSTNTKECLEVIFEEGVAVFVSGLGSPGFLMERARKADMFVMALAGNVRNARKLAADGAEVIIAQGTEGGAHTGYVGSITLWPQVVDAVSPLPVLAAGGIADGRGLAAALAMGCQGVWVGSAFLTTDEAETEHWKKIEITKANDESTTCSRTYTGKNARSLKNEWIREWKERGPAPLPMPLQFILSRETLTQAREDDARLHAVMVGEAAGMLNEIKPAAQVVAEMAAQAESILERMGQQGNASAGS